jgi:N-hydroxyarylamine O-acetyltransferase
VRTSTLDNHRVDAYLARLGSPSVHHDREGLAVLQAAHLRAVPFHNLLLLVNDGQPYQLQALDEVIDEAIAGVGGNCDRTTPPFTALLQSVGFDAQLVAATVREPGDHFACMVRADGGRFLCDVGNGHPYMVPWSLDGGPQEQSFNGWRFVFDPNAPAGPTLLRDLGGGQMKTVYVVDPTPRHYGDFAPMVNAHYSRAGFGPFLNGLRSVSIGAEAVLTLRDAEYARYTRHGRSVRRVHGREAIRGLLETRFKLQPELVDRALSVLARRRPDLLGEEPRWMALGRGTASRTPEVEPPSREAVPDILISTATVGRQASVARLLRSIEADRVESRYPGRVGVLLVENHDGPPTVLPNTPALAVQRVPIHKLSEGLRLSVEAGVVPTSPDLPVPIGVAREAQLHALHAHLQAPVGDLPHPAEHATVVWMVDDDVEFRQLGRDGVASRATNLLYRAARLWATLPQHSVALGTFTGDPPVPGLDSLGGQLHDLAANAARLVHRGPSARWAPPKQPVDVFDAYYDLTEAPPPPADAVWPYAPEREGQAARDVALALLRDLPRLLDGQQLTRRLRWGGEDAPPRPSLRRGGNTLFLDLDALFRWPTPVLATADGVVTRRADSMWAALAQAEDPAAVVEVTLPVLHVREGQSNGGARESREAADQATHSAAQVRGVVLTRALADGREVVDELPAREARVRVQREALRSLIGELRGAVDGFAEWGDVEIDRALSEARDVLRVLDDRAARGAPRPGRAEDLDEFLRGLPDAVAAWRRLW